MCTKNLLVIAVSVTFVFLPGAGFCQDVAHDTGGATESIHLGVAETPVHEATGQEIVSATEPGEILSQEDTVKMIRDLHAEIAGLRRNIAVLQKRVNDLEAGIETVAKESRAGSDKNLDDWHRRAHSRGDLQITSKREFDEWHLRDHRTRGRLIEPNIK